MIFTTVLQWSIFHYDCQSMILTTSFFARDSTTSAALFVRLGYAI
jgi:hypothetical protein